MNIKKIPVKKINPAEYNPRKDLKPGDPDYEKLKRSMQTFGYIDPIVWNEQTGNLVGGHQRFKILISENKKLKEIEASVVDLDLEKEKALNIALNKISGDWDKDKLAELLLEMDMDDVILTGFDLSDLEKLGGVEDTEFSLESFLFDDAPEPVWFVIRADVKDYEQIKDHLKQISADDIQIEDSQDGQYQDRP